MYDHYFLMKVILPQNNRKYNGGFQNVEGKNSAFMRDREYCGL
jgi:hypothetical protein